MSTIQPLNILQRLNYHFGLAGGAEIKLNQEEQQIYNSMLSQLLETTELPIEEYTTLDIDLHPMDEEEEEGKDKDDFGNDEEEEAEEGSPESQPTTSGSEYIPSPVKQVAKRPDDEYLEKHICIGINVILKRNQGYLMKINITDAKSSRSNLNTLA